MLEVFFGPTNFTQVYTHHMQHSGQKRWHASKGWILRFKKKCIKLVFKIEQDTLLK